MLISRWLPLYLLLLVLLPVVIGPSIGWAQTPAARQDSANQGSADHDSDSMVERLRQLAIDTDNETNPYANQARAEHLRQEMANAEADEVARYRLALGGELLRAGDTQGAIDVLETLRQSPAGESLGDALGASLALAYLRLGEQENCLRRHNSNSCLMPIRGDGVHEDQTGSRNAVRLYSELLERHPEDLTLRWLLNLAYMTLGEHPEQVPAEYLVPPEVFASEVVFPRWREAAPGVGVDAADLAGGTVLEDLDGDGDLDLIVSSWSWHHSLRLFVNLGNGSFEEKTATAGLTGINGGLNLNHADFDNDGDVDIFVPRGSWLGPFGHHPNSLLSNEGLDAKGNLRFVDVTEQQGLLSFHPTQTAVWGDFNGDGWIDLFVGNESFASERHPCELFLNRGAEASAEGTASTKTTTPRFEDVAVRAQVAIEGFVKGAVAGDFDNDGRLDIYLSRLGDSNILLRNEGVDADGIPKFRDVTQEAGVGQPINSFPAWFWDYDNDGWLDIFVSGYGGQVGERSQYAWESYQNATGHVAADYLLLPSLGEWPRLYRNTGKGKFDDVTAELGLDRVLYTMGANFGDVDNDGWLDLYLATGETRFEALMPNRMFRNDGARGFQDVTTAAGVGHVQKGHGVSFGDIDNDGDQDIYAVMGGAYQGDGYQNALFENPGSGNRWIVLKLVGQTSSRDAQGARLQLRVKTPSGPREIHRTVGTGGSFGASSLRQEIGLGDATAIEWLEIRWPASEPPQRVEGLGLDKFYEIQEGQAQPRLLKFQSFGLAQGSGEHHATGDHAADTLQPPS